MKNEPIAAPLKIPQVYNTRQHAQALQGALEKFLHAKGQEYNSLGAVAEAPSRALHPSNPRLPQYANEGTSRMENYVNAFGLQLELF